tara:strand:+ start:75 stop:440 length:366 start_codon:yes stop_codon:yes gene_type:complete
MGNAFTVGYIELQSDKVESGHRFRHCMLDLQTGIEFNEGKSAVAPQKELDSPKAAILGSFGELRGVLMEGCPLIFGKAWGWRHLDNLLSPALQAAISVTENNDIALLVCGYLHLDVSGVRD